MMQVQGSDARVNGEGTYTDSRDHGKQFSVGRLGNFDKSEETKMTESKILLVLDKKDYEDGMPVFERKCVRAIIEKNGKIAVQRGRAGDCKILGGGMDGEEDFETALSREVLEEGGLILCPGSMQLLGEIEEKLRDLFETDKIYHCHTYFFACTVEERMTEPHMTESEKAKGYHLEWMTPEEIVKANEPFSKEPWIYRDTAFIKMLMEGNL